ncbi:MAG TPA: amino acid adenylation domain-containing protein, partial [Longimicrobium sp.]|nr:amino acid adenylation domain-containing protein [Longimicrobium sp.]
MPFEKLVAELQPERSLSHSPLFQVLFTLQNAGGGGGALPGLDVSGAGAELGSAQFDLSLTLAATARGLRGGLNYSTDLFERGTIVRMIGHLARVLEQVAADADVRLSRLELLGDAERALVLEAWNRTEGEYPAEACIHQVFQRQAARTPDAVAVVFEDASLTYAELNARANRLAHHLRGRGVGAEVRVGICLERSLEMVVSLLAVLKAGGAYVPLDPGLPAERLAYMLDDSAVPLVLVQAALRGTISAREGVEVLAVDALAERLAAEPAENPAVGAGPDSLAYVIYTSGSTGRPKGVMNHHRGVVNLLWSMRGTVAMAPGDRLLAITTLAFDISVLELFLPLLSGARVEILDRSAASDPALLREAVAAGAGTVLQATPATWRLLLDAGWEGAESLRALSGGEALPAELAARLRERVGALWNVYGPTETTIWSTAQHLGAGPDVGRGHVSIGAPVANTRVYVLDRYLSPVPAGVPGELYIGGGGVARGYLGRPGLSAEKFVPDPFAAEPGARLYRTGDLARWRPDGTLEFLGRNDHQVKVRGFRIELGEIEAALRGHEEVADCVVMAREDVPGEQRLVAYLVGEAQAEALRGHLRQSLPEYMVPSAFVFLDALPLTPNGKLDRKALPAPEYAADSDRYVAPRTPAEEVLAGIWAEVLRLERVGVTESFFALGGHSLLATRVVSRIRELFGVEVPLRALFEGPTVADLAGRVEEIRRAGLPVLPPVVPTECTDAVPLSFAQERLWFLDRLEPGSATYNIPAALRLTGALDEAALERSLGEIVRRHGALRTVFTEVDGSPAQVVAPFGGFALPVEDLSGLGEANREAALRRRAREEAARPFDLSAGPLFRAALLRLGAEDHVLLLSMHHIVSDGWSMGVFFRELSALYEAYREGRESPLPELAVQYADYAVWQREQLGGEVLERQLSYWRERLAGAPELLELPIDHPRPAVQTHRGATVPFELSP